MLEAMSLEATLPQLPLPTTVTLDSKLEKWALFCEAAAACSCAGSACGGGAPPWASNAGAMKRERDVNVNANDGLRWKREGEKRRWRPKLALARENIRGRGRLIWAEMPLP